MADDGKTWRDIRPVALSLLTRDDELLVFEYHDAAAGETFYRPPGGGIEFGESAADAAEREFAEELGWDVRASDRLAVLENRFTFEGTDGHEYALVYSVEPSDDAVYEREEFVATETGGEEYRVVWKPLDAFRAEDGPPLYPDGLLSALD
jgi:8-oxo-dGTP pyrophosphatase MutT (NUDIX family)